ncbi:MAG: hypothetical protein GY913_35225 [Proteobacteria bacterium]|nr:hypothetical protein [Pseudomonadota bacterium]MCP4922183.1 hypothetical protein [Pseudomonadota bacterium]
MKRVLLLLSAVAWLVASFATTVHEIETQHVVCAEHGEVVEVHGGEVIPDGVHVSAPDGHEHGCAFDLVGEDTIELATASTAPLLLPSARSVLLDPSQAPRGPPLVDAPKTSPPA